MATRYATLPLETLSDSRQELDPVMFSSTSAVFDGSTKENQRRMSKSEQSGSVECLAAYLIAGERILRQGKKNSAGLSSNWK